MVYKLKERRAKSWLILKSFEQAKDDVVSALENLNVSNLEEAKQKTKRKDLEKLKATIEKEAAKGLRKMELKTVG